MWAEGANKLSIVKSGHKKQGDRLVMAGNQCGASQPAGKPALSDGHAWVRADHFQDRWNGRLWCGG